MHGHNGRIVPSLARFGSVIFIALTVVVVVGSPTTDLLESMDCLLRDCESCFPNADRNTAQNLIVRLQVTIDSVRGLLDSLDRGEARNTARILVLQRNLRNLRDLRNLARLFALSEGCQRFLMEVEESADLGMKYLYLSAGESPEFNAIYLVSNNGN